MSRLIAVSNRTSAGNPGAGGLAVALRASMAGTDGVWVGWSGKIYDFPSQRARRLEEDGLNYALIDLAKPEFDGFYLGYSNAALWPVLHNRLDLARFEPEDFRAYQRVNARFAETVRGIARDDDVVWVHDFHLLLMARSLRAMGVESRIGIFLHTPFPAPDVFRAVPGHRDLGAGLCAHDLIGVQTRTDLRNLARYLAEEFGAEATGPADGHRYRVGGRTVRLLHCPIGLDAGEVAAMAVTKRARKAARKISRLLGKRDLVLGVDRLDYSKGLPQRFEGLATLFDQNPDRHGSFQFTQVAPPSRADVQEYIDLRETLDRLAGRINGDYGDLDWVPIRYLARGYGRDQLAGLYRLARVALVTPLQDGMNLVAKEFVAAQDPDDPGVLVLSRFAGAAEQMELGGDGALIINPHDSGAIAEATLRALDMDVGERRERWAALWEGVREHDIHWWGGRYLDALREG